MKVIHVEQASPSADSSQTRLLFSPGGWVVIGMLMASMTTVYGIRYTFGLLIGPIKEEFGWTAAQVGFAASVNLLLSGLTAPATGVLLDRLGSRWTMSGGTLLAG